MTVLLVAAIVVGLAWWALRPRPTLDGVAALIDSGRFRLAEARLREYRAADPSDERARLLLAKVLVDRPERNPTEALALVDGLRPVDTSRAARAREIEGDAHFWAERYDRAEPAWLEALRLQPTIPEVGWKLLNIYAIQGRHEDSRRLALRLSATETDERDRVQLLLQLIRHDAHAIEAGSIVHTLEPVVKTNSGDFRSATALGLGMIGCGRADEGIDLLRAAVRSHEEDAASWMAYFDGLMGIGGLEDLARGLDDLPRSLAELPRFDVARGWVAAQSRDLETASRAYRRALDVRPTPAASAYAALAHRLKGILRQAGKLDELRDIEPRLEAIINFPAEVRGFFDRLSELPDLGLKSHPDEFRELAAILVRVGRVEEADAWIRLAGGAPRGQP